MGIVNVVLFGSSRIIVDAIEALLASVDDVQVKKTCESKESLLQVCKNDRSLHIVLFFLDHLTDDYIQLIRHINEQHQRCKILIISLSNSDQIIYKTIRAGARGVLNNDTTKEELHEAILTIRSGYDYYSKSISRIVINNYIRDIDQPDNKKELLTARETEILKLWGESYTNKEIADKLFISIRTVETHKNRIMQKINLKTSVDLMKFAIKNDIIQI
jgi:DNA-binding NarL/FixJ family response regulator